MTSPSRKSEGKDTTGSPGGEPVFLAVGRLGRPHGVGGAILMRVLTGFPERLQPDVEVFVGPRYQKMRIQQARFHGDKILISFQGIINRGQAGDLRNLMVFVQAAGLPALEEGEYYYHELIGLEVFTDEGEFLGRVVEIIPTGANDVYVVQPITGKKLLLPAIEEVVLTVNLQAGTMKVHLIPGLLPD